MDHQTSPLPPHVLIFPLPFQGHVISMLRLAELLCLAGTHVTVLVSDFVHGRLRRHADVNSRFAGYSGFQFRTISDGLSEDHPRAGERVMDIVTSVMSIGKSLFRELMVSSDRLSSPENRRPVTCVIIDGVLSFAAEIAGEMGIPSIYFRTISACSFWANFCIPQIMEAQEVPLKGKGMDLHTYRNKKEMDLVMTSVPGMEGFLRQRDLPGFCRVDDVNDPIMHTIMTETHRSTKSVALILNTFEAIEGPTLSLIRNHCQNLFSIGPLHEHLKSRLEEKQLTFRNSSGSFWEEDRSSIKWLNSQENKSVIYVSFGSVTVINKDELMEFWYGLVNSGKPFLWVIRPESIAKKDGTGHLPTELEESTKQRGCIVGWAPQEEVLAHPAIGGFLTHSGWNSTLESIVAGVPMICWPYFADQWINSRFVGEIWKLGFDIKDTCDRVIIERMIRDLMDVRRDEFHQRTNHMAELAKKAVRDGGTSYYDLDRLIELIRSMIV